MILISKNVPSFASSLAYQNSTSNASDTDPTTQWTPTQLPAWIAYDLSAVPAAQRQNNLVVWNDERPGYIYTDLNPFVEVPIAYTIEINTAAGGSGPPTTGWQTAVTVEGNDRGTKQHLVKLAGANWVRMTITQASDPAGALVLDLDAFSAPEGATDSWLFMGDSITFLGLTYYGSDLPALVQKLKPERFPAIIVGAIPGTSAQSAVNVLDATMLEFPGQFVVLAYGTNDLPDEFPSNMELLVQKVIASGRVPVVPHMPWSDQRIDRGPVINAAIDLLYQKYPEILRGPDLWTVFKDRNDLIPPGDLHPNDQGKELLRQQWAKVMADVP
jgi:hypothetical protein